MNPMRISIEELNRRTIRDLQNMRATIDMNPDYQREGNIWSVQRRATLIDTILNEMDIPKLYFSKPRKRKLSSSKIPYQYEVIDGKQRLDAIFDFLDGKFSLNEDFILFENSDLSSDERIDLPPNATFNHLMNDVRFSHLADRILDYKLSIQVISTPNGDMINELFLRLNESSSLNAAERRNAIVGQTKTSTESLADHEFWQKKSPIKGARFKYRELSSKFLSIEDQLAHSNRVSDVKAPRLMRLFQSTANAQRPDSVQPIEDETMREYERIVRANLDKMLSVFDDSDPLLSSVGTVTVLYMLFRESSIPHSRASREALAMFERARRSFDADELDENELAGPAKNFFFDAIKYNSKVQSSGDGAALEERRNILNSFILSPELQKGATELIELASG